MQHDQKGWVKLSPREADVLALLCEGLIHKEIATQLGLRPSTVSFYICELHNRLKIKSSAVLVALAVCRPEAIRGEWFEPSIPSVRDYRRIEPAIALQGVVVGQASAPASSKRPAA